MFSPHSTSQASFGCCYCGSFRFGCCSCSCCCCCCCCCCCYSCCCRCSSCWRWCCFFWREPCCYRTYTLRRAQQEHSADRVPVRHNKPARSTQQALTTWTTPASGKGACKSRRSSGSEAGPCRRARRPHRIPHHSHGHRCHRHQQ